MAKQPRSVDEVIARTTDYFARLDGYSPQTMRKLPRYGRNPRSLGKRLANIGLIIGGLIAAFMAFGLFIAPLGWTGLFLAVLAVLVVLLFFGRRPLEKPLKPHTDATPNPEVVRTLDAYLQRQRTALPAPAARRVDAISQQLPLLESRLNEVDLLDPLAQDARRLMGKHLPELIDRYERVPVAYRHERDGDGMTVDERLIASLDAANQALDEISRKLTQQDLNAFETQGRFIESRYKDGADIQSE